MSMRDVRAVNAKFLTCVEEVTDEEVSRDVTPFMLTEIGADGVRTERQTGETIRMRKVRWRRERRTLVDGVTTLYTDREEVRRWEETERTGETGVVQTRRERAEVEVGRDVEPFMRTDKDASGQVKRTRTGETITRHMETRERVTTTYTDGRVIVGEWELRNAYDVAVKTGDHSVSATTVEPRKVEICRETVPVMGDRRGGRRYGLFGPRSHNPFVERFDTHVTEMRQERTATTYTDGRPQHYSDWRTTETLARRRL
jgi:hypothetical protein